MTGMFSTRPPWVKPASSWHLPVIDAIDELEELAALLRHGLLSRHEFDRQNGNVLARCFSTGESE